MEAFYVLGQKKAGERLMSFGGGQIDILKVFNIR